MPLTSSLRDRRLTNRQIEPKQQYVIFWIRQAWFAIPIDVMYRAIPIEIDVPIITHGGIEIPIMDISDRLFPNHKLIPNRILKFGNTEVSTQRSLILVQSNFLVGILIDSQPILHKMLASEFIPISENYERDYEISANSELIKFMAPTATTDKAPIDGANHSEIFLLNIDFL